MTTEEIVSLTIYNALRSNIVSKGYLPNIEDFDVDNEDITIAKTQTDLYLAAMKDIESDKGYCIEVFPYSSNQNKGYKKVPRIVVDIQSFLPGNIGTNPAGYYELVEGMYIRKLNNPILSDLQFFVYAVANEVQQLYTMNEIIMMTLPYQGYIKKYNTQRLEPYNNLFVVLNDKGVTKNNNEGVSERYFNYEIPDIQELPDVIAATGIPPIREINVDFYDTNTDTDNDDNKLSELNITT